MVAVVAVESGEIDQAVADLRTGYPFAVRTEDMPIVATIGVAVAWVAAAVGRAPAAARSLGASARLRGSDDVDDPIVARLAVRLRGELGDAYDEHHRKGKALTRSDAIEALEPRSRLGPGRPYG